MAANSKIEWTECTWNPVTGCTKISLGCLNCYAERMAKRLQAMGQPNYRDGFRLTLHPRMLDLPLHWRQPRMIFVNSMSDLFHKDVPFDFILKVFDVMKRARRHCFQVLTKRSERLAQLSPKLPWPENVWMGVTVESSDYTFRIDLAIVGGESGPGARPMRHEWVTDIRDQCLVEGIPFFFKQWDGLHYVDLFAGAGIERVKDSQPGLRPEPRAFIALQGASGDVLD
jgi:protein gp37